MKKMIISILALFLCGCAYPDTNPDFHSRILDWQNREMACQEYPEEILQPIYDQEEYRIWLQFCFVWVRDNIKYAKEELDYWSTSCKAFENQKDDCDGKAIALWRMMRDNRLPDDANRLMLLYNPIIDKFHMVCHIRISNSYYIADPSSETYTDYICESSFFFFNNPELQIILEFNLYSIFE